MGKREWEVTETWAGGTISLTQRRQTLHGAVRRARAEIRGLRVACLGQAQVQKVGPQTWVVTLVGSPDGYRHVIIRVQKK